MKRFNINLKLIESIQHLYNKAKSAVYFGKLENGSEQKLELSKSVYFHPHFSIFCLNK